jgi:hypothetical protein
VPTTSHLVKKRLYNWGPRITDFTTVYEANSRRLQLFL